jgi:hypothetical protein
MPVDLDFQLVQEQARRLKCGVKSALLNSNNESQTPLSGNVPSAQTQ